jgi:uncharacterized OB-fold protein
VIRGAKDEYAEETPYVLAYVELEEGPRIMTNIVSCSPKDLEIGQEVEVTFHQTSKEAALPRFNPI